MFAMLRFRQRGNSQVTGLAAPVSAQSRHILLPLPLLCLDVAPSHESRDANYLYFHQLFLLLRIFIKFWYYSFSTVLFLRALFI